MRALFNRHYYNVMKGGQDDTILESDRTDEECDREDKPNLDVACYARAHLKSNLVQTDWSRNNKNFRNESTITSEEDSGAAVTLGCAIDRGCSVHHTRSYEDFNTMCSRSTQATGESNQQHPLLNTGKTAVFVEHSVECEDLCPFLKQEIEVESRDTVTAKCSDTSIQCEVVQSKMRISNPDEHQYIDIPNNRGLAACRTFSLGSSECRRLQNERCKTKLIGGWRVPVTKNYESRF